MTKIKKILTAIGNPFLNNELKKIENFEIIGNDIQYQEGIFEAFEINKNINFIILSQLLPGELKIEEIIDNILTINSKIKIILILEKYDDSLEETLKKIGVYRIIYNDKVKINDIVRIINEDEKMEKYNEEIRKEIEELKKYIINNNEKNKIDNKKINTRKMYDKIKNKLSNIKLLNNKIIYNKIKHKKYINNLLDNKNNKIISILGNNGSGKSIFSVLLAMNFKKNNKKTLIIDFDILNNSLHTLLGVKKYNEKIKENLNKNNLIREKFNIEDLIIKINNKIDLISGINLIFDSEQKITEEELKKIINKLAEVYDVVIIDTTSECFFEYTKEIISISDKSIFLTEGNLLEVSKSKRLLDMYYTKWKIDKEKIEIIFNKFNKNCIDINLLKKIYNEYYILGVIKLKTNYNKLINSNFNKAVIKDGYFSNKILYKKIIKN